MLFKPDAIFPESLLSLKELPPEEQLNGILLCFYDAILNCNGTLDKLKELESVVDPEEWQMIVTGMEEQSEYPQLGHPVSVAVQSGEFSQLIISYLMSFPPVRQYILEQITKPRPKQDSLESSEIVRASSVKASFYGNSAEKPTPILEDGVTPEQYTVKMTVV